ncbi:MAG: HU family DNA-binding protein [Desulfarculales bacterium]|jgi:DNA-binding protein HU-beta|nr:HU family DNA-binding protein [Desulfarculales bacterium]
MTQADFINAVYQSDATREMKISKATIKQVLLYASLTGLELLRRGIDVPLFELGVIKPVVRAAREARNPRTGDVVNIPEHYATQYRPSKAVKNALKGVPDA